MEYMKILNKKWDDIYQEYSFNKSKLEKRRFAYHITTCKLMNKPTKVIGVQRLL